MERKTQAILVALGLFVLWTAATWVFEGRIETFRRPDAVADRLIYTGLANLLIGIVGSVLVLRALLGERPQWLARAAFGSWRRTLLWAPLGFLLGLALYLLQGPPSLDPVVVLNAYAQVLVVSAAEVAVCWAVVAGVLRSAIGGAQRIAAPLAAVVASVLFGLYHFAHSPPFDSVGMIAFLTVIGLVTSAFFIVSMDVYGTILFHNFLGVFGVVEALSAGGQLDAFRSPQMPLMATALVAAAVFVAADLMLIDRPGAGTGRGEAGPDG